MIDGFSTPRERIEAFPTLEAYCMAQTDESLAQLIWDANHQRNVFASYRGTSGDHALAIIAAIAARATFEIRREGNAGERGDWCGSSGFLDRNGRCRNPDGCTCDVIIGLRTTSTATGAANAPSEN